MKALVTGASGGIGSAVAEAFANGGHGVLRQDLRAPADGSDGFVVDSSCGVWDRGGVGSNGTQPCPVNATSTHASTSSPVTVIESADRSSSLGLGVINRC